MNRFITGGISLKENLVILLIPIVLALFVFQLWKVVFAPKPVVEARDTYIEKCLAHSGCLFVDEIPKGMLNTQ